MEMKDIIANVNSFSPIARERELTEAEKEERQKYRQMYLEQFKAQVRGHLDNIKIVDGEVKNDSKFKII